MKKNVIYTKVERLLAFIFKEISGIENISDDSALNSMSQIFYTAPDGVESLKNGFIQEVEKLGYNPSNIRWDVLRNISTHSLLFRTGIMHSLVSNPYLHDVLMSGWYNNREKYCVVLCNIDNFHDYIIRYSHFVGDIALAIVAIIIEDNMKEDELLSFFMHDTIAVTFTREKKEVMKLLREIKNVIPEIGNKYIPLGDFITASFGIAEYPTDRSDWRDLLSFAADALDIAKDRGRGIICGDVWGRRKNVRVRLEMDIEFRYPGEEWNKGKLLDISLGGISFECERLMNITEEIDIMLKGDDIKCKDSIKGKIVWRKKKENKYLFGISFINITEEDKNTIGRYIDKKVSKGKREEGHYI